jgi:phosphoenolpyruvate carboxykinase (ATP)
MIRAALSGRLDAAAYELDPIFNLEVPVACPDVPSEVLKPRTTWAKSDEYDRQAAKLARMFVENFKAFEQSVTADVRAAGPRAG